MVADGQEPLRLPARLLDLGLGSSSDIKLQSMTNMSPGVRYVALSFIWGTWMSVDSQLFPHNIANFELGIDFNKLPKTFQDAVTMVRQLGVQYLWIDSLCIIQGATGDFAEEAQIMESIFNNATRVLAACSSPSVNGDFLGLQQKRGIVPIKSPQGDSIFVCEFIDDFEQDVESSTLGHRGWAFQERVFARRTIFFTSTQIYWECGEGVRCGSLTKIIE